MIPQELAFKFIDQNKNKQKTEKKNCLSVRFSQNFTL